MTKHEKMLQELIDIYSVNGIKAALTKYNTKGIMSLKAVNSLSNDMIDEFIDALYCLCDDLGIDPGDNIKVVKDKRSKNEQFVSIQFRYNHNIGFRIMDAGNYSLVYMSGMGKVVSRDPDFETCLDKFFNNFSKLAPQIYRAY